MDQSHFWEASSFWASQKFRRILCILKVPYRVHNSPQILSTLIKINQVRAFWIASNAEFMKFS
jgi:hypothetical protein